MFVNNRNSQLTRNYYSRFFAELQARVTLTVTLGVSVIDQRFSWERKKLQKQMSLRFIQRASLPFLREKGTLGSKN